MKPDHWFEQLEAYLDDELGLEQRMAFEAATTASPELQAELRARRAFAAAARQALIRDTDPDLEGEAIQALRTGGRRTPRRSARRWVALGAAAALATIILVPTLLRNPKGPTGPSSGSLSSGRVVAVRFGELPGRAIRLEAGCYDQNHGACQ